jgi:hypothetical protein
MRPQAQKTPREPARASINRYGSATYLPLISKSTVRPGNPAATKYTLSLTMRILAHGSIAAILD